MINKGNKVFHHNLLVFVRVCVCARQKVQKLTFYIIHRVPWETENIISANMKRERKKNVQEKQIGST